MLLLTYFFKVMGRIFLSQEGIIFPQESVFKKLLRRAKSTENACKMEKPGASTRKKSKTDGNQVAQMLNNGTRPFLSVSRKPKQAKQNHWLQVSSKSHFPETAFFTDLSPNHLSPFSLPLSIYIPICLSQAQASSAIFT